MSKDINNLSNQAKGAFSGADLSSIGQILKTIKHALAMLLLTDELETVEEVKKTVEPESNLSISLENLERHCTTKIINNEIHFLLHRATKTGEYQESTDGAEDSETGVLNFESDSETEWMVDVQASEEEQEGRNPHISCFIPKSAIVDIKDFGENTGTWGELSDTHPDQNKGKVVVSAGKYRIHQELRQ